MNKRIKVEIKIPSKAQSGDIRPFLKIKDFIGYCKANKVRVDDYSLEEYEKKGLLYPCFRVLYPRELLIRKFRAQKPPVRKSYKIRTEWDPLVAMDSSIFIIPHGGAKECAELIERGHPLEKMSEKKQAFVLIPAEHRFKAWDRYNVTVGDVNGRKVRESRAAHYYSPWKIFLLDDLNKLNVDEYNRAIGTRHGCGVLSNDLRNTTLNEFIPFFKIVSSFAFRRQVSFVNYWDNTNKGQSDRDRTLRENRRIAKKLFDVFEYAEWIRFIRKLIELHEQYLCEEQILLSCEAKSFLKRTLILISIATQYKFQRICDDVSGSMKGRWDLGIIDGCVIYPDKLEEIFPDEQWDLEKNVRWILEDALSNFNTSLNDEEKLPDSLARVLFDELAEQPSQTAIAAIRKITKAYAEPGLWRDDEIWGGIRSLAVSIEAHGREWVGGNNLDGVFKKIFPREYQKLRKKTKGFSSDAKDGKEFLKKLEYFQSEQEIPQDKRCGQHLIIAYLTRNFSSHRKGLSAGKLHDNLPIIYSSLVYTLFVIYAEYLKRNNGGVS